MLISKNRSWSFSVQSFWNEMRTFQKQCDVKVKKQERQSSFGDVKKNVLNLIC